jgi:hypothetical protein
LFVEAAIKVLSASGSGQDRAIAVPSEGGYLVAVADGAGGTGNGPAAADGLIEFVSKLTKAAASTDWFDALCTFDDELSARRWGRSNDGRRGLRQWRPSARRERRGFLGVAYLPDGGDN